ncbi:MAG: hypothetical protein M0006_03535 [Magnetospirillum sp.]|nr:hypothetical protein [Magnetospirillum sp.]
MRFLPYVLVAAMALPIVIWSTINLMVVESSAPAFAGADLWVIGSLGAVVLVAFVRLATWMDAAMRRTKG